MPEVKKDFVTIVSGLPRSGTSMMMQMIDAGGLPAMTDRVRKPDQDNPKGYYEFEAVKRTKKDASWLEQAPGKVVKMVHLLLLDLPTDREYRVILMQRELEEVVASQDLMLQRLGKDSGDLSKEQLIRAFRAQMDKVEKYLAEHPNFKILQVSYNDMIKEPAPPVRQVNEFLGGGLDTDAMLTVVDPSLYRQRRE